MHMLPLVSRSMEALWAATMLCSSLSSTAGKQLRPAPLQLVNCHVTGEAQVGKHFEGREPGRMLFLPNAYLRWRYPRRLARALRTHSQQRQWQLSC